MYITPTEEEIRLRQELKAYFAKLITPEIRADRHTSNGGQEYKRAILQMGADGWLAIGWPKEWGGQGRGERDQLIFFEEALLAQAPVPFVTLNTVGPALMTHGSEVHKKEFLPKIARGEIHFSIGYTEPNAGTDLASLQTSAVRDGDDYIINGTKVFTTTGNISDYIWLATRTDKEAPKHQGISIFIVPCSDPGFSTAPIHVVHSHDTYMTYYHDVRVPATNIVGELNAGWKLITSQLNHERVGLAAMGILAIGDFQRLLNWCRSTESAGVRVIDIPWVQQNLAEIYSRVHAQKMLNARMTWSLEQSTLKKEQLDPAFASSIKVYSSENVIEMYRLMLDIVAAAGIIRGSNNRDQPDTVLLCGILEIGYRTAQINTFGGGVNEVQREIISGFGLKMARSR